MHFYKIAIFLVLALALLGCVQNKTAAQATQEATPSALADNQVGRPFPLSARLGDTVEVEYTLSVGEFIVETTNKDIAIQSKIPDAAKSNFTPLRFIVGYNKVIPSIEEAVQGMQEGQNKVVTVPPEKGFGAPKEDLVKPFPKETFGQDVKVGVLVFNANKTPIGKIVNTNETHAWLDTNHPLAGKTLTLNLTVLKIQPLIQVGIPPSAANAFPNRA